LSRKVTVSETLQIVIGVLCLIGVYILTQMVVGFRIRRAGTAIVADLERRKALDPASAADLPYAKTSLLRIGLRDFRPKALEAMVRAEVVGLTAGGKYYLKKRRHELNL
jgi:hypothetical protein